MLVAQRVSVGKGPSVWMERVILKTALPVALSDLLTMPSDLKIATAAGLLWLKSCQIIPPCSVALS